MTLDRLLKACSEYTNVIIYGDDVNEVIVEYDYNSRDEENLDAYNRWTEAHKDDEVDIDFYFTISGNHLIIDYFEGEKDEDM